jgi:hypothetical protein
MQSDVIYVDRAGRNTASFTRSLGAMAQALAAQGCRIVAVVPNGGLSETVGVWVFYEKS